MTRKPLFALLAALLLALPACDGSLVMAGGSADDVTLAEEGTEGALGEGAEPGPGLDLEGDLDDPEELEREAMSSPPLQLYVAHDGSDGADGRSPGAPLRTLEGAQARLLALLPVIDRNVEIRIAYDGGKAYQGQEIVWSHMSPDFTISFMPSDYRYGLRLGQLKGRPLFDGKSLCEKKAPETASNAGEHCKFFVIDGAKRPASRLRFYYLHIRHYTTTGIGLHNDGEGLNKVYGCRFEKIGNLYFPTQRAGYTAIGISRSNHNIIRNNHFVDIRNKPVDNRFMHAVYLNVQSSHNTISYNNVLRVSGDPMKVRHYSNHNAFTGNTIRYAGVAAFLDWPEGGRNECFSWENVFRGNKVSCGYGGGSVALVKLRPPPEPDNGNKLCVAHEPRVHASDNSNSCP